MEHCNGLFCISFGKLSELSYIVLPYELMLLKRIGRSARPCGRMPRRFRNRGVLGETQLQMAFQATLDLAGEGVRTIRIAYSDGIRPRCQLDGSCAMVGPRWPLRGGLCRSEPRVGVGLNPRRSAFSLRSPGMGLVG